MKFKTKKISKPELFEIPEGIFKINASAGTGKTFTLIERYKDLINKGVKPVDILMITFTNNSAEEIKNRIVNNYNEIRKKNIGLTELFNSPVVTFHAFCSKLLKKDGMNTPFYLGIKENISSNFSILEDSNIEFHMFNDFYKNFKRINQKTFPDIFEITDKDIVNLLYIVKKLCSIGLFPVSGEFSKVDKEKLKGNYSEFSALFDKQNEGKIGATGKEVNNDLYNCFKAVLDNTVFLDLPFDIIKNNESPKRINPACKDEIFNDPMQDKWIEFIGKIYWDYIVYLVKRNFLNYDFLVMFAYLLLSKNEHVRENNRQKYIMVDEFQDTDEIQMKLILLLAGKNENGRQFTNVCIVGDWKQGIYGFRNATIENIISFESRMEEMMNDLSENNGIVFSNFPDTVYSLELSENRRSSRKILDAGIKTLGIKATDKDEPAPFDEIEIHEINKFGDDSQICLMKGEDKDEEREIILKKINEIVTDPKYIIHEFDPDGIISKTRKAELKDITVLCRDKKFGLELYRLAVNKYKIPSKLNGGIELFSSYPAIILLAWLRVLNDQTNINGWAAILDNEDFRLNSIKEILEKIKKDDHSDIPVKLLDILRSLKLINNLSEVCRTVFGIYNFSDNFSDKILSVINAWMKTDNYSLCELINIIDENILTTYDVEIISSDNSITIQTIHGSKGLEYPVVFVANINQSNFPSSRADRGSIIYNSISGLRFKSLFGIRNGKYYEFSNWRTSLLSSIFIKNYDEERRLFYVAVTRAKQYLYLTSSKPSKFYNAWFEHDEICISDFSNSDENLIFSDQDSNDFLDPSEITF